MDGERYKMSNYVLRIMNLVPTIRGVKYIIM